jgi:transketolase
MREVDAALRDEAVMTIRMLAVDAVEKASSGHPGAPMGLAQIAYEIWTRHLRYDPSDPKWPDRDRFVLSAGHASMLLYGMLHLSGYDLSMDELKQFRQWGSRTPGHPEHFLTPGVETTTGPLGQGFANAVGMAAAIKMLGARFNSHEPDLIRARVFGIASDGDMMEGVSGEAASLAGHLGLDNLVFFYDDNRITIDGDTALAFSEDVGRRFEAYGWFVQRIDGHEHGQIREALDRAVAEGERPSLIVARTHIGYGAPTKQDSHAAHGEKLGKDEVAATKKKAGWPEEPTFRVTDPVRALFAERAKDGGEERKKWQEKLDRLKARGGAAAAEWDALLERRVPKDLYAQLLAVAPKKEDATRNLSGVIQQKVAELVPALAGGSADLNPSTKTYIKASAAVAKRRFEGRNIHFGIREHAMGSFANGMALTGAFIPYTATFLVFADYMRPPIRLAALGHLQCVFVFTHDSVYLGEDGPTHQPVEHLWALRAIPHLDVWRPADGAECAAAWAAVLERRDGPAVLALTRQNVPPLPRPEAFDPQQMLRGAYLVSDAGGGAPEAVVIATGSEVHVALEAKKLLGERGARLRVVSAPCWDAFERQDEVYRQKLLPSGVRRCSIELGITQPWRGVVGDGGLCIGHDEFGASAPWQVIRDKLGFTGQAVADRLARWLAN